jgi:hypothetical protein
MPTSQGESFLEESQYVSALQLPSHDDLAVRIHPVNLENRLGLVETDCSDRLHLGSSESWSIQQQPRPWHPRAGGGAVGLNILPLQGHFGRPDYPDASAGVMLL